MSRPPVSNLAVLRYLQKVHGVDVEKIRTAIAEACARGVDLQAPSIRYDDIRFINAQGRIVTVVSGKKFIHHAFLSRAQRGNG